MGPNRAQEVLALNQWGGYWQTTTPIDRAIHIAVPAQAVMKAQSNPSILIHPQPIQLNMYQWRVT